MNNLIFPKVEIADNSLMATSALDFEKQTIVYLPRFYWEELSQSKELLKQERRSQHRHAPSETKKIKEMEKSTESQPTCVDFFTTLFLNILRQLNLPHEHGFDLLVVFHPKSKTESLRDGLWGQYNIYPRIGPDVSDRSDRLCIVRLPVHPYDLSIHMGILQTAIPQHIWEAVVEKVPLYLDNQELKTMGVAQMREPLIKLAFTVIEPQAGPGFPFTVKEDAKYTFLEFAMGNFVNNFCRLNNLPLPDAVNLNAIYGEKNTPKHRIEICHYNPNGTRTIH